MSFYPCRGGNQGKLKTKEVFNKHISSSAQSVSVRAGRIYYFMYHSQLSYGTTITIDGANILIRNESDARQAALIKAVSGIFVATKDTVKFSASASINCADLYVYEIL